MLTTDASVGLGVYVLCGRGGTSSTAYGVYGLYWLRYALLFDWLPYPLGLPRLVASETSDGGVDTPAVNVLSRLNAEEVEDELEWLE